MKTRNGFVSNSSTSSFIICGFPVTKEQIEVLEKESAAYPINERPCIENGNRGPSYWGEEDSENLYFGFFSGCEGGHNFKLSNLNKTIKNARKILNLPNDAEPECFGEGYYNG